MAESKSGSEFVPAIRHQGDAVIATVKGEIDLHNSPQVRTVLLKFVEEQKPKKLIINLGGVAYMDSSAIAVLVEALQKMRKTGGKIYLTDLQPRVKGLLEIARLDTIFAIAKTEQEALAK